jgi:hypothetical protein
MCFAIRPLQAIITMQKDMVVAMHLYTQYQCKKTPNDQQTSLHPI